MYIWKTLEKNPVFHRSVTDELKWQEDHHVTYRKIKALNTYDFLPPELLAEKHHFSPAYANALALYDISMYIKKSLSLEVS